MMKAKEYREAKRKTIGWRTPTMVLAFEEVGKKKITGLEGSGPGDVAVVLTDPVET
jgi:hypothetical protein